jgi:glyoxylase-like metal-dependent hydrolase (beta-lactamase superfamily II)
MLKVKNFEFNYFGENTYLLVDEDTNKAIVVDPGMFKPKEQRVFDDYILQNKMELIMVVNTHLHLDHCFSDNYVRNNYGVKIAAHKADSSLGLSIVDQARRFGLAIESDPVAIDIELNDGDVITVGNSRLVVIHVPGHSPGGIALYSEADKFVLSGDSLFSHSIGRTDLPGGDATQLISSIREKLFQLPEQTTVLPGHGPYTSIAVERTENPYV